MTTLTTSDEYIVMIETIYLNSVWNEFIVIISYTGKASGSIVNYQFSLTLVGWLISWLVVKFKRFKFNSDGMSSFFFLIMIIADKTWICILRDCHWWSLSCRYTAVSLGVQRILAGLTKKFKYH